MPLDPRLVEMATGRNFATLTTLFADGTPQTQVMWVDADDEHVLINTEVHRAKYRNVQSDARVTVTIWDAHDPYRYVEVRGRVTGEVRGPAARDHIDRCSQVYRGTDYQPRIRSERVILQVTPDRVVDHL
jgi:PPOX class probable F420-dependent enzyme